MKAADLDKVARPGVREVSNSKILQIIIKIFIRQISGVVRRLERGRSRGLDSTRTLSEGSFYSNPIESRG